IRKGLAVNFQRDDAMPPLDVFLPLLEVCRSFLYQKEFFPVFLFFLLLHKKMCELYFLFPGLAFYPLLRVDTIFKTSPFLSWCSAPTLCFVFASMAKRNPFARSWCMDFAKSLAVAPKRKSFASGNTSPFLLHSFVSSSTGNTVIIFKRSKHA